MQIKAGYSNSSCWSEDHAHELGFEDGICPPDGVKTIPDPRGQYADGVLTVQVSRKPGFKDEDIPSPLQPLPRPADYDARVKQLEARGWTGTAMQVHNDRGFAEKDASIASAVLYTLMPPGSLIVVPDSIWTHELWAAQLFGAALRGCHVYVISPAQANAPSAAGGLA